MQDESSLPSDVPQKKKSGAFPNEDFDGFVDELRTVLSKLSDTPTETKPDPVVEPPPLISDDSPNASMSQEPEAPNSLASDPPSSNEALSADMDFWNGNVLGWSNASEPESQPPADPAPAEIQSAPPEVPPPILKTPEAPPSKPEPDIFSELSSVSEFLPPEPPSPFLNGAAFENPPSNPVPDVVRLVEKTEYSIADMPLPIPGTLNEKAPENLSSSEPKLDLDVDVIEKKPAGLVQIACIFPAGEEKNGQHFVTKLREAASRAAKDIQPVFVTSWTPDAIDLASWEKSAQLSGADVVFVLLLKKDQALFKNSTRRPVERGMSRRLVYLEQIELRTLYADVLIDLKRGA
jgi:hypothetical protein